MGIGAIGNGSVDRAHKANKTRVGSFADSLNKIMDNSTSKKSSRDSCIANRDYRNIGIYTRYE